MSQNAEKTPDNTAITHWIQHHNSLLITDKGYRVRHCEGREVHSDDNGRSYYIVDEKGRLTEDGIDDPLLGVLSLELLEVTEKLRLDWEATQQHGGNEVNRWEERQEERRDRYLARAEKARVEGSTAQRRANEMLGAIPLGQPILVGHHSERRHRSTLEKADRLYRKAFVECDGKAEHYENKAEGVGHGGVSSDDPEALRKLREQLQKRIQSQELMKACNVAIRKNKTAEEQLAALVKLGWPEPEAVKLLKGDFCGRIGFAAYSLQNNNAQIKRLKDRIVNLETVKQKAAGSKEEHESFTYEIDSDDNRILFIFEGKPDSEIRTVLKSHAFKWSPTRGAWVRKVTANALADARIVKATLLRMAK
uniref:DUF3560 domain-containing protein n=1 Tax=Yersiniaceae TaxID=1903411 RepID=UPI001F4C02A5|nr:MULTISPECIES: DUF3560 domain-containing protein [Yersiniaceae]ULG17059.1 hypothetical protein 1772p2_00073 [Serratia proteamaculans]ULG18983.1 hypothetical protein RM5p2_00042 [Serratia proteamaculans]ULG20102.1 hypothetical protein 49p3_00009 [Yersinia frederiksenii]